MQISELYNFYLEIKQANLPDWKKHRLMTALLGGEIISWRVVGITHEALQSMAKNDFKKIPGDKINRSHITSRNKIFGYMLSNNLTKDEWHSYWIKNDRTIISTSSENQKDIFSEIFYFDNSGELFQSKKIANWRHRKVERDFLRSIYMEKINK